MSANRLTLLSSVVFVCVLISGPDVSAQTVSDSDFVSISSATAGLFQDQTISLQIIGGPV